jgi:hypothetical protein
VRRREGCKGGGRGMREKGGVREDGWIYIDGNGGLENLETKIVGEN